MEPMKMQAATLFTAFTLTGGLLAEGLPFPGPAISPTTTRNLTIGNNTLEHP